MDNLSIHLSIPHSPKLHPEEGILDNAVAIVGMSCRFPEANNVDEFNSLLKNNISGIRTFPNGRPSFHGLPELQTQKAGWLSCGIDEFDGKFFGISPREAPLIDPQQRLLMEVIWESLEDANINGNELKDGAVGVFVGIMRQDYDRFLPKNGYIGNEYHHRFLGNALSAIAGRISHFMGFTGPNIAIECGSSSSLAAVHMGCQSLLSGESELVIAGGVNLILIPQESDHNQSPDGEGIATVVLKKYIDAIRDGDNIYALIRGSTFENGNYDSHANILEEILRSSKIAKDEISHIEICSSGNSENDSMLLHTLKSLYSDQLPVNTLVCDSVTKNIGYTGAAAGIASLFSIVSILKTKNLQNYSANRSPAIGVCCSSNQSGAIVYVVLQSYPSNFAESPHLDLTTLASPQLIVISAKSEEALAVQKANYLTFFQSNAQISLENIAYTTNICRSLFPHQILVPASSVSDLITRLEKCDYSIGKIENRKSKSRIGFLFTGQGSQYLGMSKDLYEQFPVFQSAFDYMADLYNGMVGKDLKCVMWEDENLLMDTYYSQPAIFCLQIALMCLWKQFGIQPDIVLGHSLGEYAAAVSAGVISVFDGLKLVVGRSRLVSKLKPGAMVAVKANIDQSESLIGQLPLDIAAVNSPTETVVSGSLEDIVAFETDCFNSCIKTHRLKSEHAFHSKDVDNILEEFGELADSIQYSAPTCVYISSTLGRKLDEFDFSKEYWQCHLRETVEFSTAVRFINSLSNTLIEIGPQPILLNLAVANRIDVNSNIVTCPSIRKTEENWITFYNSLAKLILAGVEVDWKTALGNKKPKTNLPLYPFQRQKYWFVLNEYTEEEDECERIGYWYKENNFIHPLLGYKVETPGHRLIFIQNKLIQDLPYLSHCSFKGEPVLSPGAIIEIFLAAAIQIQHIDNSNTCNSSSIHLQDIEFLSPVFLTTKSRILTTVEQSIVDENRSIYSIQIFHDNSSSSTEQKWNIMAKAQVCYVTEISNLNKFPLKLNAEEMLRNEIHIENLYVKNTHDYINFNEIYRRISKAWKSDSGEMLVKLISPVQDPSYFDSYKYISFPPILDSIVVTATFYKNSISVKKISNIIWKHNKESTNDLYIHARLDGIYLLSSDLNVISKFESFEFGFQFNEIKNRNYEIVIMNGIVDKKTVDKIDKGVIENESIPLIEKLEKIIRETARIGLDESINYEQDLSEIGIDSLMGLEIGNKIQAILPHLNIPLNIVQEHPSLNRMLGYVQQILK